MINFEYPSLPSLKPRTSAGPLSSSAQLTGALVLDAEGLADAVFIFTTASTLTTASNASVRVINGGNDCGVFWRVGSSATVGTGTVFAGSILAPQCEAPAAARRGDAMPDLLSVPSPLQRS